MSADKFSAIWVSHTSISDYLECPRAYYLKHVYRDPKTNHKVKLMSPPLALGASVHETLESLSQLPKATRFNEPLIERFGRAWNKVAGKKGGFVDSDSEYRYKRRGEDMIRRVANNPGPVAELSVKIKQDLPYFWLSEEDNIILCGKIDWLQYLPEIDSVHIIDFKTGKNEEKIDSLQLPIYYLLVHNCQKRKVVKASYWYLDLQDTLTEKQLPSPEDARRQVFAIAQKIKLARQLKSYKCPEGGCWACKPFEEIILGKAEHVGVDEFNYDVYISPKKIALPEEEDSVIL